MKRLFGAGSSAKTTPHVDDAPDKLDLSPIVALAVRTLPYLRPLLSELKPLAYGVLALLVIGIPVGMLAADLMLNRVLNGNPVTPFESTLLWLDPARFVDVDALGLAERRLLRDRLVISGLVLLAPLIPVAIWAIYKLLMIRQKINQLLRVEMIENVQAQSMRYHSGARVGDSIYRTYQDSAMVTELMAMLVRPLWSAGGVVFGVVLGFLFDWRLPLLLVAVHLSMYWLAVRATPGLRRGFRLAREANSALMSRIQETLSAIKIVKAYGSEREQQRRFEDASRAAFAGAFDGRARLAALGITSYVLAATVPLAAATYLAVLARRGEPLAAGWALAFLGFAYWNLGAYADAMARIRGWAGSGRRLLWHWARAQDMALGMERALVQVDRRPEVEDAADAIALPPLRETVTFRGVDFAYQPERPVLHGVDLVARAGTITALVGPTGSGKSTLVTLLLRIFDPDRGAIEIDDVDLRRFRLESLRAGVSIALQENLLFGTTIRENIRYAVPNASDAAVREAARIACAEEFIERHPDGYDTLLGERGAKLSTGQRQRLSIARAVIKDAPILVLDEPTASLDAETELRVMQNLSAWARGRAIFLVTHRLSTIRRADQIVCLREGRVVECGPPDELLARADGAYRRLVDVEIGLFRLAPERDDVRERAAGSGS